MPSWLFGIKTYQDTVFVSKSGVFEGDLVVLEEPHVRVVSEEPEPHVLAIDVQPVRQELLDLADVGSSTEGSLFKKKNQDHLEAGNQWRLVCLLTSLCKTSSVTFRATTPNFIEKKIGIQIFKTKAETSAFWNC